MSSDYISNNPNVRINILRKIAKEYEGYIAGIGGDNTLYKFSPDSELKALLKPGEESRTKNNMSEEQKQIRLIEQALNAILDTANGAYLTKDYLSKSKIYNGIDISKLGDNATSSEEALLLGKSLKILTQKKLINSIIDAPLNLTPSTGIITTSTSPFNDVSERGLIFTPTEASKKESDLTEEEKKDRKKQSKIDKLKSKYNTFDKFNELKPDQKEAIAKDLDLKVSEIESALKKRDAEKNTSQNAKEKLIQARKDAVAKSNNGSLRTDNVNIADIDNFILENPGRQTEEVKDNSGKVISSNSAVLVSLPINNDQSGNQKNPNFAMSAYVFCNQSIQRSGKSKDYLSLFLNGIPPIEMSRCTPYLDITVYHKNKSKNKKRFLNHEYHMRFIKQENGEFVLSEGAISNAKRLNGAPRESGLDSSFMSIFTSPQTMANGNINKGVNADNIFKNYTTSDKNSIGDQRFLEPIVPLLTLNSFQVTIAGMGYGMVSSRKGSMSLVLHDRSRLQDFAPLISLNQLSGTSIRVEFGWSHPDGNPLTSKNEIGKFLNAMRDVQFYNLLGSNLSFQNNSVNIEVQLASAGFEFMSDVSAAAGYYSPLNFINKKLNKIINDIIEKESNTNQPIENSPQEKVLKQMKIIRTAITSQTAVVKSEDYKKVLSELESDKSNISKLNTVLKTLGYVNDESKEVKNASELISLINEDELKKSSKERSLYTSKLIKDKIAIARLTEDFDLLETTNTAFQNKIMNSGDLTKAPDEANVLDDLGLRFSETISFGKLVLMYCALPMMSTCEFADVQVFFYPINNRAGGARRFTTASLPIEYSIVRNAIDERFKNEGNISVKGMFNFLANLFEDTGLKTYGIGETFDFDKENEKLSKEDQEKKKQEAIDDYLKDNQEKLTPEEEAKGKNKELTEEKKEAIYKLSLKKAFRNRSKEKIAQFYENDNLPAENSNELVLPNLQMHMEVLPAIDPEISAKSASTIENFFFGAIKKQNEDGYLDDKKILRIHVYDTRSNGNPRGELLNKILNDDVANFLTGNLSHVANDTDKVKIVREDTKSSKLVSKIPTRELKYYVKRSYPNVTWGASSSVIKSLSVSSNTSDKVSKLIMIRRQADERAAGGAKNRVGPEEEVSINPSSISLEILGCPFIDRGTQIFVDTGTGTDLDNVYTVNNITHSVNSGMFMTSLSLTLTAQGAISSTRKNLANKLKTAVKVIEENSETKTT